MISPGFPADMPLFTRGLARVGADVIGVGDQPKADSYEGEGYVILRHPDTRVVIEGLQKVVTTLQVELGGSA